MHGKPLTRVIMMHQLVRLNDTWPRWDTDDAQFERMAYEFHSAFQDLDAEAVEGGVSIWIRTSTGNRWPSPAQIRESAMKWVQANRDTRIIKKYDDDGACSGCGAKPRWALLQCRDHQTGEEFIVGRQIHPCDEDKHHGTPFIPYPPNFIRWAPDEEASAPRPPFTLADKTGA